MGERIFRSVPVTYPSVCCCLAGLTMSEPGGWEKLPTVYNWEILDLLSRPDCIELSRNNKRCLTLAL